MILRYKKNVQLKIGEKLYYGINKIYHTNSFMKELFMVMSKINRQQ